MHGQLIGGAWVPATEAIESINPSDTRDIVGLYASGTAMQIDAAVEAAGCAQPAWAAASPQVRADALDAVGTAILARKDELGDLLAREEGKTLPEAVGEVVRTGQIFKFFGGEALRQPGDWIASTRPGVEVEVRREPLGVVGLITPWNFPMAIPAWKAAPALAFGNAVVLKPAELTPGCAWALAAILHAHLPEGVFNLVMGSGGTVGQRLVEHPQVAAVSFTGSQAVGARIAQACLRRGARYQLEMGGKNPLVIADDADLEVAVNAAINGAFYSTGQRCTASSRLIACGGIHDAFVEAMVERLRRLKVGDARAAGTDIGPLVEANALDRVTAAIDQARWQGAELAFGGQRPALGQPGFYLEPTLFLTRDNALAVNQDEIFGPLATLTRVGDLDEAIQLANDTPFGLSAGICTQSLATARRFKREARAGMVMVNLPTAGVDHHVPFGGSRASSVGPREQGRYAVDFYTTVKTAYTG